MSDRGATSTESHRGHQYNSVYLWRDSTEQRQTSKEILWVVWCRISERGEEKRRLAVPNVGSRAGARACSCQLLLSGPVRKTHCASFWLHLFTSKFLGNIVIIIEWCMKILSLTSSQVTTMLQNRVKIEWEMRGASKKKVDESKDTQHKENYFVNSRREQGRKSNCITIFQITHLAELTWECVAPGAGAWPRTKRRCHALCWLPVNLLIKHANGGNCRHSWTQKLK